MGGGGGGGMIDDFRIHNYVASYTLSLKCFLSLACDP